MREQPPHIRTGAVAVKYDPERDRAPRLVARGRGVLAERILEIAKENGIPIRRDPDLLEVLGAIRLEAEIPEDLYQAVAEVLAFAYRVGRPSAETQR